MSTSATPPRRIAIIGGGIMGASTLSYLVSSPHLPRNSSLLLLEAAQDLAPGASGKAGGFLAEDWHAEATASLASLSFRLHKELAMEHGGADKWGWREVETLSLGFDSSGAEEGDKKKKQQQQQKGRRGAAHTAAQQVDWIDADHVATCSRLGGGGTTAQVTPGKLIQFLVEEAQRLGRQKDIEVDVRLGTTAKRVTMDQEGRKVSSLIVASSSSGDEECLAITDVVLAAGPWTGNLVKTLFSSPSSSSSSSSSSPPSSRLLSSATRITGSRAHSVIIKGSRPITNHCLFTEMRFSLADSQGGVTKAAAPEVYARADGTVYVCGGGDEEPLPATAEQVRYDERKTRDLIQQTAILAPDVFSIDAGPEAKARGDPSGGKGTATLVTEQACYLPLPKGNMLLGGEADRGVWLTAGASCWGITLGLGTGAVMADLILNGGKGRLADISRLQG